ncbi:MAG: DNA-binding protein WhiA [Clostridiales bacterium]|nr:DNA-binding protein WhiA [Clostridiales bacterium]
MTYTDKVKKELSGLPVKNACCRRALARGLVYGATVSPEGVLSIPVGSREAAEFTEKTLREVFGDVVKVGKAGGRSRIMLTVDFAAADSSGDEQAFEKACPDCEAAFLRGVFLACATLSDPHSASYHAEFVPHTAKRTRSIYRLLDKIGCPPKIINRKNGTGLYFKDSEVIEELLVKLGATRAAFDLMNCKIERAIRNDENRATNCVARNIARTVAASRRQIEDIHRLAESGRLETMPYDIRVTAKLRLEHPEASLAELAALHKPPISKSGLNHRLEKIAHEAEKID